MRIESLFQTHIIWRTINFTRVGIGSEVANDKITGKGCIMPDYKEEKQGSGKNQVDHPYPIIYDLNNFLKLHYSWPLKHLDGFGPID